MKRRLGLQWALAGSAAVCGLPVRAQPAGPAVSGMKALGNDRFQIGRVVVDKGAGRFTVPGRVHVVGKPLEYLATSPGGMKEYEALFELDATGSEFNLACILIGLERDPKQAPWQRFRQVPRIEGRRVAIHVAWTVGGQRQQVPAAQALLNPDAGVAPESVEWVYTGAPASEGQARYVPDETGTLIGFVHDANCIIEAAVAIGLGAYGSVRGHAVLPPIGSAIELVVEAMQPPR